jgi:hypothetical protein
MPTKKKKRMENIEMTKCRKGLEILVFVTKKG